MRLMLIYGVPYLTAHPLRGPEYLQYLSTILNADLKYSWTTVLQYDMDFRQHRQNNPQHSWAESVTDLKMDLQASHNLKPKNVPSFRGQHQGGTHDTQQFPICENFNKGICCKWDCRYRHVCKICKKPGHNTLACRQKKDRGYNNHQGYSGNSGHNHHYSQGNQWGYY